MNIDAKNSASMLISLLRGRNDRGADDVADAMALKAPVTGGLLVAMLVAGGCVEMHRPRPLRPLELATSLYSETVTSARTGSLMYERGCLLFREDGTAARLLPIWPEGSIFNGTSVIFHQPAKADQRIAIGEQFVIEGEDLPWASIAQAEFQPFRQQCPEPPFFVSKVRPAD